MGARSQSASAQGLAPHLYLVIQQALLYRLKFMFSMHLKISF